MKVFQVGLRSIWLSGFLLILLSLYATQRLPPLGGRIMKPARSQKGLHYLVKPKITIFSAPSAFNGSTGARQILAVRSWLALSPRVTVVLFSQDPSVLTFAGDFGSRVLVETSIDFTFLGTPFFHSMMARSNSFKSQISVMVHPEAVLLPDFISTLNFAYELDHDWLLVAFLRNISHFSSYLDKAGKHWQREDSKWMRTQELQEILGKDLQWNLCKGKSLIAWNTGDLPLYSGVLPPFLYGKGVHDNWVVNEALSSEFRFVFDASWTISSSYMNDQVHQSFVAVDGSSASTFENRNWEYVGNSNLGLLYGSWLYHKANYSNLVKLLKCEGQYIFVDTTDNTVCPFGYQSTLNLWKGRISHSRRGKKISACVDAVNYLDRLLDCSLMDQKVSKEAIDFPFSLETLLPLIVDKNKTVILAVAGYSYKDMLMSWVCRLRHLQITNFIISALDEEIYRFSILQGLPVFRDVFAPGDIRFNNCHFGTKCFQRVTKVKSRMVLKILKLGYNVLLSDVDIYWFGNPLPFLYSFGPASFMAQSDEYNQTGPINLPRRLNSGFYFARSDNSTISAMEKVVKHAANSGMSEQPSFYDTLCGEGGSNRVGDNTCVEPETNLTVYFLDRDLFPNGAYLDLWQRKDVRAACEKKGCLILHNNWISGRQKKLERQNMCVRLFGLPRPVERGAVKREEFIEPSTDRECGRKKDAGGSHISVDVSSNSKGISVRIIHAGRREELYYNAVPASQLMKKYPGMCIARPDVFKNPHGSFLWPDENLLPGQKYYMIPSTTAQKLKRKYPEKMKIKVPMESQESKEDIPEEKKIMDPGKAKGKQPEPEPAPACTAKEYLVSSARWSRPILRKGIRERKPFVPPIPKARPCRAGFGWEPSLPSVQEISP